MHPTLLPTMVFFGRLGWRSSGQVETPDRADGCALLIDMGHEDGVSRTYWWKWFPNHERAGGGHDAGFTPQNKPAQEVIAEWYLRTYLAESQEADRTQR